ncbi:MAG: helix-turn-helix domain-containing protein [Deltaproteobacteria bacterium]|nr:helix-turn-helix domain-containing protein [Deltaproteobacteria bacterium]
MQSNRVGNLLSAARLKATLSQAQLAAKLGVRQNMISDYERGKRRLTPAMAKRIAGILDIKVERIS